MFNVMDVVTTTVNWIRANALKHHKLKKFLEDTDAKFLEDTDAEYGDVVMFTAMTTSSSYCVLHPLQLHLALTNLLKLKANAKLDIKLICVFFSC